MRIAPYDLRLAARTLALAVVALAVVALVEWITDERGVATPGTGGRSIGLLPLVPIAGAIAVVVALAPAQSSGELRALAALGASPLRARLSPIVAATLLAIASALAVAGGCMDVAPLFPPSTTATDYRVEKRGDGGVAFVSERRRVRVEDDVIAREREPKVTGDASSGLPPHAVAAAALTIALAGCGLAAWVGSPFRRRPLRTLVVGALYGAAQVAAFQSAGARAIPALAIVAPSILLLAVAAFEHRASARLRPEDSWI